jgi:hypothetical protein
MATRVWPERQSAVRVSSELGLYWCASQTNGRWRGPLLAETRSETDGLRGILWQCVSCSYLRRPRCVKRPTGRWPSSTPPYRPPPREYSSDSFDDLFSFRSFVSAQPESPCDRRKTRSPAVGGKERKQEEAKP